MGFDRIHFNNNRVKYTIRHYSLSVEPGYVEKNVPVIQLQVKGEKSHNFNVSG